MKNIFRLYNIFILLLILLFVGLTYIYQKEEVHFNKNKLQKLTNTAKQINEYFTINKSFIFSLKNVLTNNLQISELSHPAYYEIKEKQNTYNILCVLDGINSSLSGIGKLEEMDIDTINELHSVLYLKPLFKTILNSRHDIQWVYYTSAKDFIYIAPSNKVWGEKFLVDIYKKEFWLDAIPSNNLGMELVLTKLYEDAAGKGLLTTLSLPISSNNEFIGVLSIDIGVKTLNSMLNTNNLAGSTYLINQDDQILASNKMFKIDEVLRYDNAKFELSIFNDLIKLVYLENTEEKIITIMKNSISQVLLLLFILSIIYILCYLLILNKKVEKLANKDFLTSLLNRRAMRREANKLLNVANRYNHDTSLLLLDIDFFKNVNDTYGHHTGDSVLKEIARVLIKSSRESELVSRYGGEEFLIVLSNSNKKSAYILAERIRKEISFICIENINIKITVSIGCTQYIKEESLDNFIKRADDLLYKAKNGGRNQTLQG